MPSHVVILTGAGISAESGLPTFRDAKGLWEGHRPEQVATPEAFERDPVLVHRFYNMRRAALGTVQPNAAHLALARLQREFPGKVTLVTQNVDDLHERAGSTEVIHMHGELLLSRCIHCDDVRCWLGDLSTETLCPSCGQDGGMRPYIVWFGEMPMHMVPIDKALRSADLFVAIGTSGLVYPAAGFVRLATGHGADTLEINSVGTEVSYQFRTHMIGPATQMVPKWVERLLGLSTGSQGNLHAAGTTRSNSQDGRPT
jgi:NAD-dependent protein deacetylase/lipoamidase